MDFGTRPRPAPPLESAYAQSGGTLPETAAVDNTTGFVSVFDPFESRDQIRRVDRAPCGRVVVARIGICVCVVYGTGQARPLRAQVLGGVEFAEIRAQFAICET